MSVSHLGHVEPRVPDVAASVEFLQGFVGLRVTSQEDDCADIWGNNGLTDRFNLGTPVASELATAVRC
jgi:catechol 2,3-dioxygenase-like lactoylglutathione lyase family enzyme